MTVAFGFRVEGESGETEHKKTGQACFVRFLMKNKKEDVSALHFLIIERGRAFALRFLIL